ncbi:hypothetical protein AVEN_242106-1, partial [Araneus ventricosus]
MGVGPSRSTALGLTKQRPESNKSVARPYPTKKWAHICNGIPAKHHQDKRIGNLITVFQRVPHLEES